jgi:biopolymer transport protein ExbB
MDEVRIDSGVARSGDWIKLCYQNQRADSAQTLVALGTINHTATGPYAAWFSSKNIVLNTKATGANVSTTITNFPVLVRLSSNNAAIFSGAKSNGADIRFAKANGTALPYQIEQWNATSKKAAVWVLVDTIKGNDSLASIIMYYGNSSAIDSSSPGKVFDTSKGFQAVYHFSDAADTAFDATINKYTASPVTTAPADTIGIIGRARYFDGSASAYDIVGSSDSSGIFNKLHFPDNGIYTLSAWVNLTSITGLPAIIARGSGGASEYHLYTRAATTEFRFLENRSTTDGGQQYLGSGTGTAVTGIWTHVVGVRNGINMSLFLNGAVIASPTTGATGGTRTITYDVNIGRRSDGSNYFNGFIDEVQIANVARDTNWIKLSYENQKASQTLVFVEGTTNSIASQPVVSGSITLQNGTTVQLKVPGRASIACHLATANLSGVKMSIVDLYGRTVWSKTFSSSTREVSWNGETMSGNRAVAGTYIVRLTALGATNATADQKILLMK